MSQHNFANAIVDHIKAYGVELPEEKWDEIGRWLQKSAQELEEWARSQGRQEQYDAQQAYNAAISWP